MGKSVLAGQFKSLGIPVHEADSCVHELLSPTGKAFEAVKKAFPTAYIHGSLDRKVLGALIFNDKAAKTQLEAILHPLVRESRKEFLQNAQKQGHKLAVIDVPLLFETGIYKTVDHIITVTAPPDVQKQRVLSRPGMTEARFNAILSSQWPDAQKRAHAHTVIHTDRGLEATMADVKQLIKKLNPNP